jgi:hypothetical protein
MLEHVQVEPELEIQEEYGGPQAPSYVGGNNFSEQGKPRCIPLLVHRVIRHYATSLPPRCALSLQSWHAS